MGWVRGYWRGGRRNDNAGALLVLMFLLIGAMCLNALCDAGRPEPTTRTVQAPAAAPPPRPLQQPDAGHRHHHRHVGGSSPRVIPAIDARRPPAS